MDPLNKQERTEAFIKTLAIFLLAVIVVAIPMYYAFRLPEKEKTLNQKEYNNLNAELKEISNFEQNFLIKTDSAISLFNAYKIEEDELARDKLRLRYSSTTNEMEDYLKEISDDTIKSNLYNNIIFTYNNLFSAWAEKNELQSQLDECKKTNQSQSLEITKKTKIVAQEKEKTIKEKEIDLIKKALDTHNGSIRLAAAEIGSTERKLKKRMKELGIAN
ncbi:MAG: hypothetical protein L3J11_08225 [Draconibacterium sp.]|nr:hypothetical protein [Draconibacterium sp.]